MTGPGVPRPARTWTRHWRSGLCFLLKLTASAIGMDVLRHRVIVSYEAEAEEKTSEDLVQQIFDTVEVP